MKESKLFYANRIGWSALAMATLAADFVNINSRDVVGGKALDLGQLTNRVGSAPGAAAILF